MNALVVFGILIVCRELVCIVITIIIIIIIANFRVCGAISMTRVVVLMRIVFIDRFWLGGDGRMSASEQFPVFGTAATDTANGIVAGVSSSCLSVFVFEYFARELISSADDIDEPLDHGVRDEFRVMETLRLEEVFRVLAVLADVAVERHSSLDEQKQAIELVERVRGGRVHSCADGERHCRTEFAQDGHHFICHETVEACCGLIEVEDVWLRNQRETDVDALRLAAADTLR